MNVSRIDDLRCPDCGSVAQGIGHYYHHDDGGLGFEFDTLYFTKDRRGERYHVGQPGVELVETSEDEETFGVTRKKSRATARLAVTHWCTNDKCGVVFPRDMGRKLG